MEVLALFMLFTPICMESFRIFDSLEEVVLSHVLKIGFMEVILNEKHGIELRKVFNGLTLVSDSGETITICMRDMGFEFTYQGKNYFAKEGFVEPFNKSVRGNELVDQRHTEEVTNSAKSN